MLFGLFFLHFYYQSSFMSPHLHTVYSQQSKTCFFFKCLIYSGEGTIQSSGNKNQ